MYKKTIVLILLLFLFTSITVSADSTFESNMSDEDLSELFSLTTDDIKDPLTWITSMDTYILVETKDNGRKIYWMNTPNLQTVIYNQATGFIPTGYLGSGAIPSERNDVALIKLPTSESRINTAMQKYGFRIPSPPYVGETPRVTMSVSGVLIERNPIKFVANKIRGLFGGDIISMPDSKTYSSLRYVSPSDYYNSDNTFERWAELYWDDVISSLDEGQVIIRGADSNGFIAGTQYVKQTVITDNNLNKVNGDAAKLNDELKLVLGPQYQNVISSIITLGVESGIAETFDSSPSRLMPYDIKSMKDIDSKNLVEDPRSLMHTPIKIFGININLGIDNIVLNNIFALVLNFAGFISELTVFLNGITTFTMIENSGYSVVELWQSPIMTILAAMLMIFLVVTLLGHIIRVLKGDGSLIKAIGDTFISFLLLGLIFAMFLSPDRTYNSVKSMAGVFLNFGTQTLQFNDVANSLMGSGTASEKADTSYWIPYFSLWSHYNTGKELNDRSLRINLNNAPNEPEQDGMIIPTVGDREILLWNAVLADSFTKGPGIDKSSYRVVDHLMAPRFTLGQKPNLITTKRNENFTGTIQRNIDLGIFLMIIMLFFGVLIKIILFLEAMYYLAMFPVNLALASYGKDRVKGTFKKLVASFAVVGIWDIAMSMIIFMSMETSGIISVLLSLASMAGFIKGMQALAYSNSVFTPMVLKSARKFM